MLWKSALVLSALAFALQGCGSGNTEEMATLQKQVAALTRQVEETRQEIAALQNAQQKTNKLVGALEEEILRFKEREIPPSAQVAKPAAEAAAPAAPRGVAKVSCAQVWKLLGQGKDEATIAHMLSTTLEAVQACEQGVGRRRKQR